MKSQIASNLRIGRDSRILLIFLAAILNQPFWGLIVIALVMNIETVRRMIVSRDHG